MNNSTPILQVKGVIKRFPNVTANDNIDLHLHQGEILALLGENGAGKSTLMNMIYGLSQPDAGEIWFKGKQVTLSGPRAAIAQGVGMVHQHFQLVPVMSVAENVMLGAEITKRWGRLDYQQAIRRVQALSSQYSLKVEATAVVETLPVGIQQRVEILKALYRDAEILILDEPTAVLTPQEATELFRIMHQLTERGVSIIFITHKLKEVLAVADRITVLRRGQVVGTVSPHIATESSLAEMMVGRSVMLHVDKSIGKPEQPILQVKGVQVADDRGQIIVDNVSFTVHAGEILGIAGVQGNGQRELVEALTRLRPLKAGQLLLEGHDVSHASPRHVTEHGVAHIPEDREKHGLVMAYSVADNIILNRYYQSPYANGFLLNRETIMTRGQQLAKKFDVRAPSIQTLARHLSGGNKQKVIVAREFSGSVKLLIANQPTRGIDVGSIEFIHRQIVAQRDDGTAVLLVSAELDEVLNLADRVAVMFAGRIVAILPSTIATREEIGLLMAGASVE